MNRFRTTAPSRLKVSISARLMGFFIPAAASQPRCQTGSWDRHVRHVAITLARTAPIAHCHRPAYGPLARHVRHVAVTLARKAPIVHCHRPATAGAALCLCSLLPGVWDQPQLRQQQLVAAVLRCCSWLLLTYCQQSGPGTDCGSGSLWAQLWGTQA